MELVTALKELLSTNSLLAAIIGATITILVQRQLRRSPAHIRLERELDELLRHYKANVKAIVRMQDKMSEKDLADGTHVLSVMHIEKLKLSENAAIFDREMELFISKTHLNVVNHLKQRLLNRNIEAQRVVDYMQSDAYDVVEMNKYLMHLHSSFQLMVATIEVCQTMLRDPRGTDPDGLPKNATSSTLLVEKRVKQPFVTGSPSTL